MGPTIRAILLTVAAAPFLHGGPALEEIPTYKLGMDALSGRLWGVAAARFEAALETEDLDPEVRQELLVRLAEARVRANNGSGAIEILDLPDLAEHPARGFWRAQALAATGRFQDAIDALAALPEDSPHRREAQLTRARLQRAIDDLDGAFATLEPILKSGSAPASAKMLKAQILLDQNKPAEALEALPDPAGLAPAAAKASRHLRARCLLANDEPEAAASILEELISSPENQSLRDFHQEFIDLAQARIALGKTETAADGLLAFIQQTPDSPVLDQAFDLLLECLPAQPAPNDAILTRLKEWVPPARIEGPAAPVSREGSAGAWPQAATAADPLAPQAMLHLALGLRRLSAPDAPAQARRLLTRLRLEYPKHPLVSRALLVAGRWELENGNREQANACFDALQRHGSASSPELRAQALTLEASALFLDKEYDKAAALFDQAAELLEFDRRHASRLNAATSLLAAGDMPAFDKLRDEAGDPDLQVQLALERALYLASRRDPESLPALEAFISQHPGHPRIDEARLAAALAALDATPPLTDKARESLGAISENGREALPPSSLALAEIRLHKAAGEWDQAAASAAAFLKSYPDAPAAPAIRFERGRALFQNKDFNEAQLELKTLVETHPNSPQAPAALLLSAAAAAEGATPQSQAESIQLFDRLIESDSPFRDVARLEKADMLIRLSRLDEAVELLQPWFAELKDDEPLLLNVGLLLGDALFAKAEGQPEQLESALAVYERLLAVLPEGSPARYRVLYQKGLALEQFEGREDEALLAYMDVIQAAAENSRPDWQPIELCGFSALRILEKRENWPAAMKLAARIANLKGPRSDEFAERAKTIGMEHFIWDQLPDDEEAEEEDE
ncbi:hypothetical protein HAHE_28650 [Haloferula helveola]|uniref:Tetratricopeptide repeat protein n=1 Tax=Haloferula helveola TaxID=490095 RepID=A0ABM7RFS3_9BACT|nr:hypothetical protein HAHE_28650 [Haloferula helveola]